MKKFGCRILAAIILICSLAGCSSGSFKNDMAFSYLLSENIGSLDPQTAKLDSEKAVISMIFEGLCRLNSIGEPVPGAAEDWESNEDYTQFTFYLRDDATWSEGSPLLAEDFVFGIQRSLMPSSKAIGIESLFIIKGAAEVNAGQAEMSDLGVSAIDDHTVVFDLTTSYKDFPKLTAESRFMPCQKEFFEDTMGHYGMETSYTLTNGPFTFATKYAWDKGVSLQLARTVYYKGGTKVKPSLINLKLTDDNVDLSDPISALINETVDILQITGDQVTEAEEKNCEIITLNDSVYGLLLNTQNEVLKQPEMREIYIRSINRQEVLSVMGEQYDEALGIMARCVQWDGKSYQSPGDAAYALEDSKISSKIPRALAKLEDKSITRLPSLTIICLDDKYSKDLANSILVSWNKSLPNVFNLEALDAETYYSRLESGSYQAALYSFAAEGSSPISVLTQFSSKSVPQLLDDPDYDAKLKNLSYSKESYRQLEEHLMNEFMFYPIHYIYSHYAMNPKVKDIVVATDLGVDFTQAQKRDG